MSIRSFMQSGLDLHKPLKVLVLIWSRYSLVLVMTLALWTTTMAVIVRVTFLH